jgi:hypothetical protein
MMMMIKMMNSKSPSNRTGLLRSAAVVWAVLASFTIVQLTSYLPTAIGQQQQQQREAGRLASSSSPVLRRRGLNDGYGDLGNMVDNGYGDGSDGDSGGDGNAMEDDDISNGGSSGQMDIESFFTVEYEANDDSTTDICTAAAALATAYNNLIENGVGSQMFVDPFNRRMTTVNGVDVESVTFIPVTTRALTEVDGSSSNKEDTTRALQFNGTVLPPTTGPIFGAGFRILVALRQRGTSVEGCPGNCNYSNDSLRRRLGLGGFDGPFDPFSSSRASGLTPLSEIDTTALSSALSSTSTGRQSVDLSTVILPSQDQIRDAYNTEIVGMSLSSIVGVTTLVESNSMPEAPTEGTTLFPPISCNTDDGNISDSHTGKSSKSSGSTGAITSSKMSKSTSKMTKASGASGTGKSGRRRNRPNPV